MSKALQIAKAASEMFAASVRPALATMAEAGVFPVAQLEMRVDMERAAFEERIFSLIHDLVDEDDLSPVYLTPDQRRGLQQVKNRFMSDALDRLIKSP